MKKEKVFDFDETYKSILEQAKKCGMYDDMVFQTLMREFKNANDLCLRLNKDIEKQKVSFIEEGSTGQKVMKTNPVIKDYVAVQKSLVNISKALEQKLANINSPKDNDWM